MFDNQVHRTFFQGIVFIQMNMTSRFLLRECQQNIAKGAESLTVCGKQYFIYAICDNNGFIALPVQFHNSFPFRYSDQMVP